MNIWARTESDAQARRVRMKCGRSAPELILSAAERAALEHLIAAAGVSRAVKQRSRVILACAMGKSNVAIAREVGLTNLTVGSLRRRFPG